MSTVRYCTAFSGHVPYRLPHTPEDTVRPNRANGAGRFLQLRAQRGRGTGDAADKRRSRPHYQHTCHWTVAAMEGGAPGKDRCTARLHWAYIDGLAILSSPSPPVHTVTIAIVHAGASCDRTPHAA